MSKKSKAGKVHTLLLGQVSAGQGKLRITDSDPFVGLRVHFVSTEDDFREVHEKFPEHDRVYLLHEDANPELVASRRMRKGERSYGLTPAGVTFMERLRREARQ